MNEPAAEYAVCHECACVLVNGEGDPAHERIVTDWAERNPTVGYLAMACPTDCDHPVSYVLPCDICREVGHPFGLHAFQAI